MLVRDMALELDDVTVGDNLGVHRGQQRSGIVVDCACAERGDDSRCCSGREGEGGEASHCDDTEEDAVARMKECPRSAANG